MGNVNPTLHRTAAGEAFTLRSAVPEDAAALLDYVRAVTAEYGFFVIQPHELPATVEVEQAWIESPAGRLLPVPRRRATISDDPRAKSAGARLWPSAAASYARNAF